MRLIHDLREQVQNYLLNHLDFLPPEMVVLLCSALPIIELRGGMPLGTVLGLSFKDAYMYSLLGNIIPIAPILLLFAPFSKWALKYSFYERLYGWLGDRAETKGDKVKKYGPIGLILFTAVPLPTTGAFTACAVAVFFFIPFRQAFVSISIGVLIASVIVGILCYPLY